ncbi:MAG: hypothetical protein LUE86_01620 [Clostridiales bacterium]|nr:hypothetical protein [Clostridiales bacterium]
MAYVSLLALVVVVILAVKKGMNPGISGLCAAFILGFFVMNDNGVPISSIAGACKVTMSAFPTTMFLRIMFSAMLFSILSLNGTLQILTDKILALAKGNQKLFPIIIFFLNMLLSFVGVNTFTQLVMVTPICVSIAHRCKQHPILLLMSTATGARAGYTSQLNVLGITMRALSAENGIALNGSEQIRMTIISLVTFAVFYIAYKGYKLPRIEMNSDEKVSLNKEQWISLIVAVCCIILAVMGFELSVLSAAFTALLLAVIHVDEKKVIASVPWATITTICGMTMLVKIIQTAGGIDVLIDIFQTFMSKVTCVPFFMIISALLSAVSSATGVVLPTLYPTLPSMGAAYGIDPSVLGLAIAVGSTATGIMPFSTVGATFLGLTTPEDNENNYLFNSLLICSGTMLLVGIIAAFVRLIG